ncbi:MAG: pyrophosphatase PpaX [Bacillota bacterium]|nr:pyrophosphatase PpaX [Bacillota bacterium]
MTTKYSCVLFDLDGTLLNTNNLIIESFKYTLDKHLNLRVSEGELYKYFGEPLRTTLARYDENQVEQMLTTYRQFNMDKHDELTTAFPGAVEVVQELHKNNIKLGVVTSKLRHSALKGIELAGISKYLDTIVAYEDTSHHKPEAAPIMKALKDIDHPNNNTIMIGDSLFDMLSAKNAEVDSVAVEWSVHSLELLAEGKPNYVIKSFYELLDICI